MDPKPYKVHVTVCGTPAGAYEFARLEEARADMESRKKFEVLGCYYRLEQPRLTRDEWIARVTALLGEPSGFFDPKQYATDMAEYYYDEAVAFGLEPETPEDAIQDEIQAGL